MITSYELGLVGEWRAARYLRKHGVKILARRFRFGGGEIDLIGREGDVLCFIEVKYRPHGRMGDGAAAVDRAKQRRLRTAAQGYLVMHPADQARFDVLEITAAGEWLIKNAF